MTTEQLSPKLLRPLVLVVDDDPVNCAMLLELLSTEYEVAVASSGAEALDRLCAYPPVDLVLLDVDMPGMNGYQVCLDMQSNPRTCRIPVIFVTVSSEDGDEARGLGEGAVDYITKPYSAKAVLMRVHIHLSMRATQNALRDQNNHLEQIIAQNKAEAQRTLDAMVFCLATQAEPRAHISRVRHYVRVLAEQLQEHPRFSELRSADYVDSLCQAVPLHDIGKLDVPERILQKPGQLDAAEWKLVREHPTKGREALLQGQPAGSVGGFLNLAAEIAYSHHEKWDGSGYPLGLTEGAIPLSGRMVALADVYDALISHRCYKEVVPHDDAVAILAAESGKHFDPDIVEAFMQLKETFRRIALKYADEDR